MEEKKDIKIEIKKYAIHIGLIVVTLFLLSFAMKYFEDSRNIYSFENWNYIIATMVIWGCEYLIVKGLTNNSKLSLGIVIGVEALYDIINYIVRIARGSSIAISDIFAFQTALSVSKYITIKFDSNFVFGALFIIAIIAIFMIFRNKIVEQKDSYKIRISKVCIGIIIVLVLSKTKIYSGWSLWDLNNTYRCLGTPMTILRMIQDFRVKPPEGYNRDEVIKTLSSYDKKSNEYSEEKPNIIVIVNESFCDYYNTYNHGNANPIEYYSKLEKSDNVISGTMYSSEFGGRTSNVEYEFLTQNSMRILSKGSYVFQQYVPRKVKSSIVEHLRSIGYKTSAIHPWENFAYSRNKVYPLLGFQSIKFKDDIEGLEKNFNNDFFTDESTYRELLKEIDEKKENEKLFEYVLTVQNHIGYLNTDPEQIDYSDDFHTNVYMQLAHDSSEALKDLIEELKDKDEKYILLFFGDHQPNLDDSDNGMEREMVQYETSFLIWANYEIETRHNIRTSTIYLQNYLLKAAGVELSAMNNYMEELQKYYPIITKRFYEDNDGNVYREENDTSSNYDKMKEYDRISYYRIFDKNQ